MGQKSWFWDNGRLHRTEKLTSDLLYYIHEPTPRLTHTHLRRKPGGFLFLESTWEAFVVFILYPSSSSSSSPPYFFSFKSSSKRELRIRLL